MLSVAKGFLTLADREGPAPHHPTCCILILASTRSSHQPGCIGPSSGVARFACDSASSG